jgi:hypothetical protein
MGMPQIYTVRAGETQSEDWHRIAASASVTMPKHRVDGDADPGV